MRCLNTKEERLYILYTTRGSIKFHNCDYIRQRPVRISTMNNSPTLFAWLILFFIVPEGWLISRCINSPGGQLSALPARNGGWCKALNNWFGFRIWFEGVESLRNNSRFPGQMYISAIYWLAMVFFILMWGILYKKNRLDISGAFASVTNIIYFDLCFN